MALTLAQLTTLRDSTFDAITAITTGAQSYTISGPNGAQRIVTKASLSELNAQLARLNRAIANFSRGSASSVASIRRPV